MYSFENFTLVPPLTKITGLMRGATFVSSSYMPTKRALNESRSETAYVSAWMVIAVKIPRVSRAEVLSTGRT